MATRRLTAFATTTAAAALLALALAPDRAAAATAAEIDRGVTAAISKCYAEVAGCKAVADTAKGMLVFPEVTKAGLGVGGSYGTGALKVGGDASHAVIDAGATKDIDTLRQKDPVVAFLCGEKG